MPNPTTVRLDKFLSNAGVVSRRSIKRLLLDHIVSVNGTRVRESGTRIVPDKDVITIDNQPVKKDTYVYFLLNKPKDTISTTSDEQGRTAVTSLIKTDKRIYPVGRLDRDTHGLLLLTNDGELTHKLIHPKYHVPKVYALIVQGRPTSHQLTTLRNGVMLSDGITAPAEVDVVSHSKDTTLLHVTLHEGRNRQIRRMCESVGLPLLDLERIAFGKLTLTGVSLGKYRSLTQEEIEGLREAVKKEIPQPSSLRTE